jgi:preprotein translocase subunit SecD
LLGQTAKLEFKLVDENGMSGGVVAPGDEIVPFANGQGAIAVKRLGGIKGDRLTNATQSFSQNNEPVVSITFDNQGGEQFARLTSQNVGKPFAIILDGKVLSAPNINEPIMGGSARFRAASRSRARTNWPSPCVRARCRWI